MALDIFEIIERANFEFLASRFIADDDTVLVHLEHGDGPHMADRLFDGVLEGTGFVVTINHDKHLFGVHDGSYTYGQRGLRHFVDIIVEETAVGDDGVGRQLFLTGAAGERRTRFVERDMSVRTDTAEEQVDTADITDLLLITRTLGYEVRSVTVQDIDILLADVDMREEVIPHEAVITLGVLFRQVDILVHVKGYHVAERHFARFVEFDELAVHT